MFPTKFQFIWQRGFRGEKSWKSANQKQELPVAAMFVNGLGQNEQYLQRTFHRSFLPSFGSFGQAVSEEKNFKNQPIRNMIDWLIDFWCLTNATLSYIMTTSFCSGRSRSTRREQPTTGKQLVNFITWAASRVHPFCNLQSRGRTHAVLVIGLYELLCNPTT